MRVLLLGAGVVAVVEGAGTGYELMSRTWVGVGPAAAAGRVPISSSGGMRMRGSLVVVMMVVVVLLVIMKVAWLLLEMVVVPQSWDVYLLLLAVLI